MVSSSKGVALICRRRISTPILRNSKSSSLFLPRGCSLLVVLPSAVDFRNDGLEMTGSLTSNGGAYVVCKV